MGGMREEGRKGRKEKGSIYLPTYLGSTSYLPTYIGKEAGGSTYYLPTYQPSYTPTYLPTYIHPPYPPTYLPTYTLPTSISPPSSLKPPLKPPFKSPLKPPRKTSLTKGSCRETGGEEDLGCKKRQTQTISFTFLGRLRGLGSIRSAAVLTAFRYVSDYWLCYKVTRTHTRVPRPSPRARRSSRRALTPHRTKNYLRRPQMNKD